MKILTKSTSVDDNFSKLLREKSLNSLRSIDNFITANLRFTMVIVDRMVKLFQVLLFNLFSLLRVAKKHLNGD